MSILIKGIDLPEKNQNILLEPKDGKVFAEWIDKEGAFHIVPVVEIPTPHGRLIDGDKLIGEFIDWQYTEAPDHLNTKEGKMVTDHERQYEIYLALGEAVIDIANAPTILEAEE